jgi:Type IV secretion system proteins
MTKSKRILCGAFSCAALIVATENGAQAGGIPVVDVAALGEWAQSIADDAKSYALQLEQYVTEAKTWATENLQWLQQVQQYALQGEQYLQEAQLFMNFFHNPSLGTALGALMATGLGNGLPISPYAVVGLVNGLESVGSGNGFSIVGLAGILGPLSALSSQAWTMSHVYSPTDGSWASAQIIARGNGIAGEQGAAQAAYTDLRAHADTLQPLRTNLLAASDTKSVLDATGQINTEIAWNVNELAQMTAISATYQAQSDSIIQRDNEHLAMDIDTFLRGSPTPAAVGGAGAPANGNLPAPPVPPAAN